MGVRRIRHICDNFTTYINYYFPGPPTPPPPPKIRASLYRPVINFRQLSGTVNLRQNTLIRVGIEALHSKIATPITSTRIWFSASTVSCPSLMGQLKWAIVGPQRWINFFRAPLPSVWSRKDDLIFSLYFKLCLLPFPLKLWPYVMHKQARLFPSTIMIYM